MKKVILCVAIITLFVCGCGNSSVASNDLGATKQVNGELGGLNYVIPSGYEVENNDTTKITYKNSDQDIIIIKHTETSPNISASGLFDSFFQKLKDEHFTISNIKYYKYSYRKQASFELSYDNGSLYKGSGFAIQTSSGTTSFILAQQNNEDTKQFNLFFNNCTINSEHLTRGTLVPIEELSDNHSSTTANQEVQVATQKATTNAPPLEVQVPTPAPAQAPIEVVTQAAVSTPKTSISYQSIYDKYVKLLNDQVPLLIQEYTNEAATNQSGLNGLAEIVNSKISSLAKTLNDGISEMASYMYSYGSGKYSEYQEWAGKLYEVYQSCATQLYSIYTQ